MKLKLIVAAAFLAALPLTAQAQGVPAGAAYGFHEGNRMAGPVGAVVGTVVGGVTGGINGVLGVQPYAAPKRRVRSRSCTATTRGTSATTRAVIAATAKAMTCVSNARPQRRAFSFQPDST